ncbi:50S ribosomal protein L19 [Candidatus Saccharibacteria bacterium]|nr:50S ribosomal protein L19 [Candidatus Saccharibacteria bacterium]
MSFSILKKIGDEQKKKAVVDVRSGDTVKVTQRIKEGDKSRLQVFEGVVIRADRKESHTARITVRKIASGVGVEKSFLLHSPLVEKIEVVKRSKVRRNNLSYLRERSGKSARLSATEFDRAAVNDVAVEEESAEEVKAEASEEAPKAEDAAKAEAPKEEPKAEEPAKEEPKAEEKAE